MDSTTTVGTSVVVETSIDQAFKVFTEGIGDWWPPDHHILDGELAEMIFEPREGGYVFDRGVDGRECRWARVLVFDPPSRFVIAWHINPQWQIEEDPDKTSEVEVRFVAEGTDRTRVDLEHRHLDRHGEGWEQVRGAVGSPEGWPGTLGRYVASISR